jgi:hypothetical protein
MVTDEGISIRLKAQPQNDSRSRRVNLGGTSKVTEVSDWHQEKQQSEMT